MEPISTRPTFTALDIEEDALEVAEAGIAETDNPISESDIAAGFEATSSTTTSTTTEEAISQSSETSGKRPATSSIEEQHKTQVKRPALRPATGTIEQKDSTSNSGPGPTIHPQQDTTAGNAANTKGSVSGEAGSRKSQKQQGSVFGLIKVSKMALNPHQRSFVWLFEMKQFANDYCEMVDLIYHNSNLNIFELTSEDIDTPPIVPVAKLPGLQVRYLVIGKGKLPSTKRRAMAIINCTSNTSFIAYLVVQQQMAITQMKYCDFVVWSTGGTFVERVIFNEDFWLYHREIVLKFHKRVIMPELLGRLFTRSTPSISTWCSCNDPDDGRPMICCDNELCSISWYHLDCVGLCEVPDDIWACRDCINKQ
nr:unnamed protein product [Callosobruchus chinensis]